MNHLRIDVRKEVRKPPDKVYRVCSLEYKIRVAEAVIRMGYRGLSKWKDPPPRANVCRWAKIVASNEMWLMKTVCEHLLCSFLYMCTRRPYSP